jgi:UDP-N-acetylmuramate--alanine ligase
VVCVFQPHRYTRTKLLVNEFTTAFDAADILVMTEIYAAGEDPIAGVSGKGLFEQVAAHRSPLGLQTCFFAGFEEISDALANMVAPGDLVLTVGAGNVWQLGTELLKRLAAK